MKKSEMVYLACPYSHEVASIRDLRFAIANRVAAHLIKEQTQTKRHVFSPISHGHPIATAGLMPTDWRYWQSFDQYMISVCDTMVVVCIDGWRDSKGVQAEIIFAKELGLEIEYFYPNEFMQMWP